MSDALKIVETSDGKGPPIVECPVCNKEFRITGIRQHWCAKHDEVIPHPWWPPVTEAPRSGSRWKWARRRVLDRDENDCQRCGASESDVSKMEVHHITPFTEFEIPAQAHAPSNLITVCVPCHRAVEGLTTDELHAVLAVSDGTEDRPNI